MRNWSPLSIGPSMSPDVPDRPESGKPESGYLRVILDANVYISAFVKPSGKAAVLLKRGLTGAFQIFLSEAIFQEIVRVLRYPRIKKRLPLSRHQLKTILMRVVESASWVSGDVKVVQCEDPDDDKYLAAAQECQAHFLVSGDQHLLKLKSFGGTKIVTINQFQDLKVVRQL